MNKTNVTEAIRVAKEIIRIIGTSARLPGKKTQIEALQTLIDVAKRAGDVEGMKQVIMDADVPELDNSSMPTSQIIKAIDAIPERIAKAISKWIRGENDEQRQTDQT